jgi:hypothetical protein
VPPFLFLRNGWPHRAHHNPSTGRGCAGGCSSLPKGALCSPLVFAAALLQSLSASRVVLSVERNPRPQMAGVDGRATGQGIDAVLGELMQDPARAPARMLSAKFADQRFQLRGALVRAALRAVRAVGEGRASPAS